MLSLRQRGCIMNGEFKLWNFEYHNGEEGIHIFGEVEPMKHLVGVGNEGGFSVSLSK